MKLLRSGLDLDVTGDLRGNLSLAFLSVAVLQCMFTVYRYFIWSDQTVYLIKSTVLYYSFFFHIVIVDIKHYRLSVGNYSYSALSDQYLPPLSVKTRHVYFHILTYAPIILCLLYASLSYAHPICSTKSIFANSTQEHNVFFRGSHIYKFESEIATIHFKPRLTLKEARQEARHSGFQQIPHCRPIFPNTPCIVDFQYLYFSAHFNTFTSGSRWLCVKSARLMAYGWQVRPWLTAASR